MHIAVNTDTEYEKREENNHFGVKCKVIGYECSDDVKEVSDSPPCSLSSLYPCTTFLGLFLSFFLSFFLYSFFFLSLSACSR